MSDTCWDTRSKGTGVRHKTRQQHIHIEGVDSARVSNLPAVGIDPNSQAPVLADVDRISHALEGAQQSWDAHGVGLSAVLQPRGGDGWSNEADPNSSICRSGITLRETTPTPCTGVTAEDRRARILDSWQQQVLSLRYLRLV